MSNSKTVTVLTDSRGLDTYYLDSLYATAYGIDSVFASRMGSGLRTHLIPDHFRAGTVENNILRVALTKPRHVVLCDGIWETLLNRQKFFDEGAALGRVDAASYGSTDTATIQESGKTLTALFLNGDLSVSPEDYADRLHRIVGYFRRRRCTVQWLSLVVPSERYSSTIHHAGRYKPLPGWNTCLTAINRASRDVLAFWGAEYIDLDPLVASCGGESAALIDLWHFSPAMHQAIAKTLTDRFEKDTSVPSSGRHHCALLTPGPCTDVPLFVLDGISDRDIPSACDNHERIESATVPDLRNGAIVIDDRVSGFQRRARDMLLASDPTCTVLYLSELNDLVPIDAQARH